MNIRLLFYSLGPFLKELMNHTKAKVAGQLDPEMKMYLYSAVSLGRVRTRTGQLQMFLPGCVGLGFKNLPCLGKQFQI